MIQKAVLPLAPAPQKEVDSTAASAQAPPSGKRRTALWLLGTKLASRVKETRVAMTSWLSSGTMHAASYQ